jgi:hypothetical protein
MKRRTMNKKNLRRCLISKRMRITTMKRMRKSILNINRMTKTMLLQEMERQ